MRLRTNAPGREPISPVAMLRIRAKHPHANAVNAVNTADYLAYFVAKYMERISLQDIPLLPTLVCFACGERFCGNHEPARLALPGCGHSIGLKCLEGILMCKYDEFKRCFMCGTR